MSRLAQAAERRYRAIAVHVDRMSRLVEAIGLELGLGAPEARKLRAASRLHDFG